MKKESIKYTVTFTPRFRFGNEVYFHFGETIRKGEIGKIFCGCQVDDYGCGNKYMPKTYVEYQVVYHEGDYVRYRIMSEQSIFATLEEAQNELPKQ